MYKGLYYCVALTLTVPYKLKYAALCKLLGQQECPLYPTEMAFALDASDGVGRPAFNNMRDTVLRLVSNITIAESNCPRGARIALTLYNNEVTTEIRFADALKRRALVQRIEGLQTLQTRKQRSLDTAMTFVAQNTFKRVRSGFLMRKVAIFFVNGPVRETQAVTNAALRLHDAGIASLFLLSREDRALSRAMQVEQKHTKHTVKYISTGYITKRRFIRHNYMNLTSYVVLLSSHHMSDQQHSTGPGDRPS